ncbi:uncharacterized conserved protein [Moesziomyces antarcticus T-34]|uniref:Uncharacterized conserved protein n=1 Tax=Pseudozyma antarctica (strain T-34) TaxID=1151754 RepID=M9MDE3_PSEA3|nr:uncharacterized conserved protein [Moesziomyces antarcticus T-34]
MDVGKLFKLPDLPSAAVNKRKWSAPQPADSASAAPSSSTPAQPDAPTPRPRKAARVDDEEDDELAPAEEETYFFSDDDEDGGRFFGGGLTAEQTQILDIMDGGDASSGAPPADVPALRKQLLRFERAITKNAEMRAKYAADPARFIESEADVDAEIKSLLVLTTQPERFYAEFVQLGGAASLVGLLSHDNADIAAAAIEAIEELTDDDVLDQAEARYEGDDDEQDAEEGRASAVAAMDTLVDALLKQSVLELVVSNLSRFNDQLDPALGPEEAVAKAVDVEGDAQAIYHALGALENLVTSRPALAEQLAASAFLPWALSRLASRREVDQNTSYTAELLAILLQTSESSRAHIGSTRADDAGDAGENGIDVLLGVLARYRRQSPAGAEEEEFAENVVDVLCLSMSEAANRTLLLEGEGVELMVLLMKEKKFARMRALKILDYATSGPTGHAVCHRLVEASGLAPLVSTFLQCSASSRSGSESVQHALAVISSMLTHLDSDSPPRIRLLARFVAHDYQALDHLLDLRSALVSRLQKSDDEYLERLDQGLFSLQLLDTILAWLVMEDDAVRDHVAMLLRRNAASWQDVVATLQEYSDNIGDQLAISDPTEVKTKDILAALIEYLCAL